MKNKCLRTIRHYNMLRTGDHVIVALSGGADSVALLHFLHTHADELGIFVSAAHFNHGIRGAEADADALFCEDFCKHLGVDLTVRKADVPAEAAARHISTEECARILRYEFLQSVDEYAKIATAHTNSDSCESFLFNLTRGTGIQGLCGIPAVRGNIIRPFITCSAAQTRQYCRENNLVWREDSTNLQTDYARNRIRHEVIPPLKMVNSSFEENALRCMRILQADNDFLQQAMLDAYTGCKKNDKSLYFEPLYKMHAAVSTRVLIHFLQQNGCENVTMRQISLLFNAKDGEVITLSGAKQFRKEKGMLFAVEQEAAIEPLCISVTCNEEYISFYDSYVCFKHLDYNEENAKDAQYLLDADKTGTVVLRTRMPGDKLRLSNRNCTKTLKQLFTEEKTPLQQRSMLPILADEKGVIWVAGFGIDESRLPDKHTKKIIRIEWRKTL